MNFAISSLLANSRWWLAAEASSEDVAAFIGQVT